MYSLSSLYEHLTHQNADLVHNTHKYSQEDLDTITELYRQNIKAGAKRLMVGNKLSTKEYTDRLSEQAAQSLASEEGGVSAQSEAMMQAHMTRGRSLGAARVGGGGFGLGSVARLFRTRTHPPLHEHEHAHAHDEGAEGDEANEIDALNEIFLQQAQQASLRALVSS